MKNIKLTIFITLFFLFVGGLPLVSIAQVEPEDPCTAPYLDCPIDDGLVLLIGAAIFLAALKAYQYKRKVQFQ